MSEQVPMTKHGAQQLKDELHRLKHEERPRVVEAIATAREHGDLSENAEYDAAKEQQAFVEARIRELEDKIARAQVIDPAEIDMETAAFGATVSLVDEESGKEVQYQIVGDDEADIKQNKISINAPIARALIGRGEGEVVDVQAPGGTRTYEIVEIEYK
ncbi:transcription elongation factor GreA [Thiohalorhabdus denitrificans]|uniref:Transcription elongation factor GreA n=1 Tax=Thiohalorhabdus denitrificans TaxID=381306 RepID=A0A0P9EGI8_9GAMM|nr:transcription elongation factor GreA [Thiohalorhabdus denitrificans]KPV41650.1 transcription elongation factor GreA [Thiohalorhabdus denitrificans]SCY56493.1 transcription elongation factor GreA [Thiohalorhabdus denitrificans]